MGKLFKAQELPKIKRILHCKYLCPGSKLVEENRDNKGKTFVMERSVISTNNVDHLIYKFPETDPLFPYFNRVEGLHRICDYVIFAENRRTLFVFICELKLKTGTPWKQAQISETFVRFILSRIQVCSIPGCSLSKQIAIRKLGIKETKGNRRTTKGYAQKEFDAENYLLLQKNEKIYLDQLMDAPTQGLVSASI